MVPAVLLHHLPLTIYHPSLFHPRTHIHPRANRTETKCLPKYEYLQRGRHLPIPACMHGLTYMVPLRLVYNNPYPLRMTDPLTVPIRQTVKGALGAEHWFFLPAKNYPAASETHNGVRPRAEGSARLALQPLFLFFSFVLFLSLSFFWPPPANPCVDQRESELGIPLFELGLAVFGGRSRSRSTGVDIS